MRLLGLGAGLLLAGCGAPPPPEIPTAGLEPRVAAAIRSAEAAVREDPGDGGRRGSLAMLLHTHRLDEAALAAYAEAARLDDSDPRFTHLPARLLETADRERALALTERTLALAPGFAPALALRARLLEALGRPGARAAWEALRAREPGSFEAHLAAGRAALADGDLAAAAAGFRVAAEIAPRAEAAWSFLARTRQLRGDPEGAREALGRARTAARSPSRGAFADADPFLDALTGLRVDALGREASARRAADRGDFRSAERIYRSLVAERPGEAGLHLGLANALARQGRAREAETACRAALARDPESSAALAHLANLLAAGGREEEAATLFRRSLAADPGHLPTILGASNLEFRGGNLGEAGRLLGEALARDPEHPAALQGLGQLRAARGDLRGAAEALHRALRAAEIRETTREQRAGLHFLFADVERQRGRRPEALGHLARAEALGMEIPLGFRDAVSGVR